MIYFPFCHSSHWYVGVIDFVNKRFAIADGLQYPPPPMYVRTLKYLLRDELKEDLTGWQNKWVRLKCPTQQDAHSCGVIALSFIQEDCSAEPEDNDMWNPDQSDLYRILWLERIVGHSDASWKFDSPKVSAFQRLKVCLWRWTDTDNEDSKPVKRNEASGGNPQLVPTLTYSSPNVTRDQAQDSKSTPGLKSQTVYCFFWPELIS